MLKYNKLTILDTNETDVALEYLKPDEILVGKINNKTAMLKLIDDEELSELKKLIDIN